MKNGRKQYEPPESRVMLVRLESGICVGSSPTLTDPQGAEIQAQDVDAQFQNSNNFVSTDGSNWDASGSTN